MDTRPLPPGWISQIDSQTNCTYYVNTNTGETSWEDPRSGYYAREGNGQHQPSNTSSMPSTFPDPNSNFSGNHSQHLNPSTPAPLGFAMPGGPDPTYDNHPSMPGSNNGYSTIDRQSFGMPSSNPDHGFNENMPNNYGGYPNSSEYSINPGFNSQQPGTTPNDPSKFDHVGTSSTYTSGASDYEKGHYGNNNANAPQAPGSVGPASGDQERFLGLSKPSLMGAVVGGLAGKIASSKLSGGSNSQPQQNYYSSQPPQGQYYGGQQPQGQYYGAPPQGQYYGGPPPQGQYGAPPYQPGKPPKESGLGSVGSVLAGGLGGMALGMVANKLMGGSHHHHHHGGKH